MAVSPVSPAMLDQSIQNLKDILPIDEGKRTAAEAADVYLASIRLLLSLKADEHSITEAPRSVKPNENDEITVHLWESTPALSAVIRDGALFRVLIRRLDGAQTTNGIGSTAEPTGSEPPFATKKRSLSISEPERKNGLSPMPGQRANHLSAPQKPKFNEVVFVATVLNLAFRRLDHWPATLVKVYAADCFGSRLWVENPMCKAFVDNLKLMHATNRPPGGVDAAMLEDAKAVSTGYQNFECFKPQHGVSCEILDKRGLVAEEPCKLKRQLSSTSWGSLSDVSVQSKKTKSTAERISDKKARKSELSVHTGSSLSKRRLEDVYPDESHHEDNPDTDSGSVENGDALDERSPVGGGTPNIEWDADVSYPLAHVPMNSSATRDRFIGDNLVAAQRAVVLSLRNRLDVKLKQNSGLLQCLPLFAGIAGVRLHASKKLGKWLQSPGLSNHARTLFSSIVKTLEASDPPLREDLETIDNILSMKLKANQFNAHLSSITKIATRLPFQQVAHNMFSYLLRKLIVGSETTTDDMKVVVSIHKEFSSKFSYNAIATFLVTLLAESKADASVSRDDRHRLLAKIRRVVTRMEAELKSQFDGKRFLDAILSIEVSTSSWAARDEEDKARLMFLGVTLAVAPYLDSAGSVAKSSEGSVREILVGSRKSILNWCVSEYGPRFKKGKRTQTATVGSDVDILCSLSSPQFDCVLNPGNAEPVPTWLTTMLCLLFVEQPDSLKMKSFLFPAIMTKEDELDWQKELPRIRTCCELGRSVSDGLLQTVLRSTTLSKGMDAETALQIVEHLFASCINGQGGKISIEDPELVWELYRLAQFIPNVPKTDKSKATPIPRLAYPSLWWRITMLALVICSTSPRSVGGVMFQEHPTIRALIKMVTSGRFRFPTIDCDDEKKKLMKREDHDARAKEAAVIKEHFLPKQKAPAKQREQKGSRVSRRLLKQQQAKEAAEVLEVATQRKKILKKAQKSIMLWDPDGPARKPPQDSVDLLLSVAEKFDLSHAFRSSSEPDFLLMTIGETSRASIERAHDWLIPIISELPSTIARLPTNASCFLLLRAYGSGESKRGKLKELSQPLLQHVKYSLCGSFGSSGAVKALDLLLTDVASSKAERRRCARRVFREALSTDKDGNTNSEMWMLSILDLPDAKALVKSSLPHLTKAATYEKGRELSGVVLALQKHASFAKREDVGVTYCFSGVLIDLVSSRPSVFADALSNFPPFLALCVDVLHAEFVKVSEMSTSSTTQDYMGAHLHEKQQIVRMSMNSRDSEILLPLNLLVAVAVVLSICGENFANSEESNWEAVNFLSNSLLLVEEDDGSSCTTGLASGTVVDEPHTLLVEPWMLLAKSSSDTFARRTALSAPPSMLCRLLLCSGLPKASFLTMLGRLGKLGQESTEIYHKLLVTSGLGSGPSGNIARMLIGRLDAYSRLHGIEAEDPQLKQTSQIFLSWLSATCKSEANRKATKSAKSRKGKVTSKKSKLDLKLASSILSGLGPPTQNADKNYEQAQYEDPCFHRKLRDCEDQARAPLSNCDINDVSTFITQNLHSKSCSTVEKWLQERFSAGPDTPRLNPLEVAVALLKAFTEISDVTFVVSSLIGTWVPRLSQQAGNSGLWRLIFSFHDDASHTLQEVISRCILTWSRSHKQACSAWALEQSKTDDSTETTMDWGRLTLYLASMSEQPLTCSTLAETNTNSCGWANSKELVLQLTRIAVLGLGNEASFRPDDWPSSFSLVFSLAQHGKNQLRAVCEGVLQGISRKEASCDVLRLCLLRLYLVFPQWMDIGSASARTALISAAGKYADNWTAWQPSLEGKIQDHISALHKGEAKVVKVLSKLSRKHPLLILRELPGIARLLKQDATMNVENSERKGIIAGTNMNGQRIARINRQTVKFSVCHWGYSFLEPLWIVWLDILSSIPKEVLFTLGLEVGLKDVLGVYLQLLSVQLQLMSVKKVERLKEKVAGTFATFKDANRAGWTSWLNSRLDGSEVRHVLMSYSFITPQEVRECEEHLTRKQT